MVEVDFLLIRYNETNTRFLRLQFFTKRRTSQNLFFMLGVCMRCWLCAVGAVNFFTTQNTAQPAQAKSLILKNLQNRLWSLLHTVFSIALLAVCCKCLIIIIINRISISIGKVLECKNILLKNNTPPKIFYRANVRFFAAKQAKLFKKLNFYVFFWTYRFKTSISCFHSKFMYVLQWLSVWSSKTHPKHTKQIKLYNTIT